MTVINVKRLARLLREFDDGFLPAGRDRIAIQRSLHIVELILEGDPE